MNPEYTKQKIYSLKGTFPRKSPQGVYDQILCTECEQLFSSGDDYILRFLEKIKKEVKTTGNQSYTVYITFDLSLINYFIASLVFRASASQKQEFQAVNLGKKYESLFKKYLCSEIPFPDVIEYIFMKYDVCNPILMPLRKKIEGCNVYVFHLGKYELCVKIDQKRFSETFKPLTDHQTEFVVMHLKDSESIALKLMNKIADKYKKLRLL